MRIGVFGGTFDPPHVAHLAVAREALRQLDLDRLLFIPAAVPPHKRDRAVTPGEFRLEMLEVAVAGMDGVEVSDIEMRRPGPSYTVDTLRALRALHTDARLFLVLGADQVRELDTWREAAEVRGLATLAAFHREGEAPVVPEGGGGDDLVEIEVPRLDISSTEIRRRIGAEEPVDALVPDAVRAVIDREGLYRED